MADRILRVKSVIKIQAEIIVARPGRLYDLCAQNMRLTNKTDVLDEADEMLIWDLLKITRKS
jgi:superfamily II DNA/RNA helicase